MTKRQCSQFYCEFTGFSLGHHFFFQHEQKRGNNASNLRFFTRISCRNPQCFPTTNNSTHRVLLNTFPRDACGRHFLLLSFLHLYILNKVSVWETNMVCMCRYYSICVAGGFVFPANIYSQRKLFCFTFSSRLYQRLALFAEYFIWLCYAGDVTQKRWALR